MGEHNIACGSGAWLQGTTTFVENQRLPVAVSGAWIDDNTYAIKLCFHETPFCQTLICYFAENQLLFDRKYNVSFGPLARPQLIGRVA